MAIQKTISIRDDQSEWLEKNHKSLSKIVQACIDREMKADKKKLSAGELQDPTSCG